MFKFLCVVVIVCLFLAWLSAPGSQEVRAQVQRAAAVSVAINQIEAMNTPATSKLADELRNAYATEPTTSNVAMLQQLYVRVKANPADAAQYTVEAKRAALKKSSFCTQVDAPLAGNSWCSGDGMQPGLD